MAKAFRFVIEKSRFIPNDYDQYGNCYFDHYKSLPDPFTQSDIINLNIKFNKSIEKRLNGNVKLGTRIDVCQNVSGGNLYIECVDGDTVFDNKEELKLLEEELDNVNETIKNICGDLLKEQKDLREKVKNLKDKISKNKK